MLSKTHEVPCVVDNQEIFVKEQSLQVNCSDHRHRLCNFSLVTEALVQKVCKSLHVSLNLGVLGY